MLASSEPKRCAVRSRPGAAELTPLSAGGLAGISQRIGYARPWRSWLLTQRVAARPGHVAMHKRSKNEIKHLIRGVHAPVLRSAFDEGVSHQIHDYLHLASALGTNPEPVPPQLFVRDEEVD